MITAITFHLAAKNLLKLYFSEQRGNGVSGPKKRRKTRVNSEIIQDAVQEFSQQIQEDMHTKRFVVFLCGPALRDLTEPAAKLRNDIKQRLERDRFEVVLGEDDGLEDVRLKIGLNAQENELAFVVSKCNAVVIVASSPGSFCELGLFSWHHVHQTGQIFRSSNRPDLIVVIDKKFQYDKSYLNEGPGKSVRHYGQLDFIDFLDADIANIMDRLYERRAIFQMDNRGRKHLR